MHFGKEADGQSGWKPVSTSKESCQAHSADGSQFIIVIIIAVAVVVIIIVITIAIVVIMVIPVPPSVNW